MLFFLDTSDMAVVFFTAVCIPGRTDVQCLHRWQKVLNPELVKGPWTKEVEINILASFVSGGVTLHTIHFTKALISDWLYFMFEHSGG